MSLKLDKIIDKIIGEGGLIMEYSKGIKELVHYKGTRFEKVLGVSIEDDLWLDLHQEVLPIEDIDKAEDWVQAVSESSGWDKYGRRMYSPSLNKLRHQTVLEFYGDSIVD